MNTDVFDYVLPERLIAQQPAQRRDESRLLVVNRKDHSITHRFFRDLPEYLNQGDCLFRNNAAVIPARLHAQRANGGQVECLLLRPVILQNQGTHPDARDEWWCLLRPGKKLPVGATFGIKDLFTATVIEKNDDGLVRASFATKADDILSVANQIGEMPLPPYIERDYANKPCSGEDGEDRAQKRFDRERYQTVYADRAKQVAAAAPTAGLHFTPELLEKIAAKGVASADLTLHVGLGTFRPIMTENIEDHAIHREVYEINSPAQKALFNPTGRRVAVGTTSVRTIEDFLSKHTALSETNFVDEAAIFIYPPRTFRGVDALITNFHQPRSTLLCLVSAFLSPGSTDGIAWLKEIYAEAISQEYRFFSYGDSMVIL